MADVDSALKEARAIVVSEWQEFARQGKFESKALVVDLAIMIGGILVRLDEQQAALTATKRRRKRRGSA